jgi:hypothetical protein
MSKFSSIIAIALLASAGGGVSQSLSAGCAVTASFNTSVARIDYDPFAPNTQRSGTFSITLTPPTPIAGQPRVRSIDYQFLDTDSSAQARVGSAGAIVEVVRAGRSVLLARTTPDFTDANSYHTINVPTGTNVGNGPVGALVADARQDLVAGDQSESFDLAYRCNYSDGSTEGGTIPSALFATVSTGFLLRATVVGGGTSRTLTIDPDNRTASGAMAIRSTGSYSIAVSSQNNLNLLANGVTNAANVPEDQKLPYNVRIGGDLMTPSSPPKMCARSGLSGAVVRVNTRLDQGVDTNRVRAGTYSDVLTVTVTPEVNGAGAAGNCGV